MDDKFTFEERDAITKIEKAIPNLDANDGCMDVELDTDVDDFSKIKNHIEQKHNKITVIKLNPDTLKRKCVSMNWIERNT